MAENISKARKLTELEHVDVVIRKTREALALLEAARRAFSRCENPNEDDDGYREDLDAAEDALSDAHDLTLSLLLPNDPY